MGSLFRKIKKARKIVAERKKNKNPRREKEIMGVSKKSLVIFRLMMAAFFMIAIVHSGYAPNKAPKLPEGVRTLDRGSDRVRKCWLSFSLFYPCARVEARFDIVTNNGLFVFFVVSQMALSFVLHNGYSFVSTVM